MNPGGPLILSVNRQLPYDTFRKQIREMHAAETPLLDMVTALGLTEEMSDAVKNVVMHLGPDEVAGIRKATLEMLDRAESVIPVDCDLSQARVDDGAAITVKVVAEDGRRTIRVRPAD